MRVRSTALHASSAVALVALFALTGCSGDTTAGSGGAAPVDGPVSAILREAWGDFGQEKRAEREAEAENLVAECMAAEGFEYVPRDPSPVSTVSEEDLVDQNTEEWIAQYGYGIILSWESTHLADDEEPVGQVDPNADYLTALSESEITAYYQTLNGKHPEPTVDEMDTSLDGWEDQGCRGWAQHEVAGDDEQDPTTDPRFADLLESMNSIYIEGQKDPRVLEAAAEWSDCMADAGFTGLTTPDSGVNSVEAQNVFYNENGNSLPPSQEAISAFRELEISTALTDFRCKERVDWEGVRAEVSREGEELWITDNKVALDEFAAALQEHLT